MLTLRDALLIAQTPAAGAKPFRVYLACGFTPLHFQTLLAAELKVLQPGFEPRVETGLYGDLAGSLSRIAVAEADAAVVMLEWADLDPRLGIRHLGSWEPAAFEDIIASAAECANRCRAAVEAAAVDRTLVFSAPTLPLPPVSFTSGWQTSALEARLREIAQLLTSALAANRNVRVVNAQRLDGLSPLNNRFSAQSEIVAGFPYKVPHAAALAHMVARLIHPSSPKKGLITDLDDTLWKGILGEVGVEGVSWDVDDHSVMHGAYQRLLHALSKAGVLIGVASKNDPALVEELFRMRDTVLPADAVFPFEVNWGPKSESVRRVLSAWNVGAADVVVVDDSAMELAEVRAALPEIECVLFPPRDADRAYKLLSDLRDAFGKPDLSAEDSLRLDSIRRSKVTPALEAAARYTPSAFLDELNAELKISYAKQPVDVRAFELINKTNQFNLNGRRYPEMEWRKLLLDPATFLMVVTYSDKFGPLGKIAAIAGRPCDDTLNIDTWVMSCRAFARGIEYKCLEELFRHFDVSNLVCAFSATDRNAPMRDFLTDILGEPPAPGCRITRSCFERRKPVMSHRVAEATRG
jgi:FkbH-like protein